MKTLPKETLTPMNDIMLYDEVNDFHTHEGLGLLN